MIKLEEAVPPSEKEVNKTEKVESSTANNKGNKEEQKKVCPTNIVIVRSVSK